MTIEEALRAHLVAHAGLTALLAGRVYWRRLPQGVVLPALCYQRISGPRTHSHTGPSGLAGPRFQLDCWAGSIAQARAVATQTRFALDGWRGLMGGVGGVQVGGAFLVGDRDDDEPESELRRVVLDFEIWHSEATA